MEASDVFEQLSDRQMPEYKSRALHYRHRNSGCQVFHLLNDDPENLFAFAFRTPPGDDSGAAHILEHSVLCGSRRFPLKDPFLVLLKSSLQTFLNAFTFPDKTVYPASSQVERDFFNLMLVAGDAAFFPLLREEVFMQEAHHLEIADPQNPQGGLVRSGVVYNEMKGVFSSAESVVANASMRSLFPDTPYGYESGGDPQAIAALTLEQLRDFHRRFYHPGNCRIFLYGDIPTARTLEFLQENFLGDFGEAEIDSGLPLQPRWNKPLHVEKSYPAESGTSTVTLNWLTVPVGDPHRLLALEVLSELLIGSEGAVLHKALLESRLGDDLSPSSGLDTELNEAVFSVGLRGSEAFAEVETLVMETLRDLCDAGVPEENLSAALHRVEFRNSEIKRGGRPYSLTLMRRALRGWLHGVDPHTTLEFRPTMDALRENVRKGGYFERLIREQLLDNPHRSTVVVRPDPGQQRRDREREQQELRQVRSELGESGLEELQARVHRLHSFQGQEDSPQVIARIPSLHLSDLRREVETIPSGYPVSGKPLLYHDLYTNGIVYLDLCFDTSQLDPSSDHLLPLFSRCLRGSGLPAVPYYDVARRLTLLTGGLATSLSADTAVDRCVAGRLVVRVKMLEENLDRALQLVGDLLMRADFRDRNRLRTIVGEMRNDLKASLVPGGSHYAALRASARLSAAAQCEERWKGVTQYLWLDQLVKDLQRDESLLAALADQLESIRSRLIFADNCTLNLTCEEKGADSAIRAALKLNESLRPDAVRAELAAPLCLAQTLPRAKAEVLLATMNVSFVAHAFPASSFLSPEHAHESLLAHFLTTGFLWERIRMRSGAYGAGASANGLESLFGFSSYRDPNTAATREAFREALEFASRAEVQADAFEKIVLGAAGKEDRPLAPGEKGFVAMKRELLGIRDQQRQQRRDALIDCSPGKLKAAAQRLLSRFEEGFSAFLSHRSALERDREILDPLSPASLELPD